MILDCTCMWAAPLRSSFASLASRLCAAARVRLTAAVAGTDGGALHAANRAFQEKLNQSVREKFREKRAAIQNKAKVGGSSFLKVGATLLFLCRRTGAFPVQGGIQGPMWNPHSGFISPAQETW